MTLNRNHAMTDDRNVHRRDVEADFVDQTIALWQPHYEQRLAREDGREIIKNMAGFFSVLREWEQAERAAERKIASSPVARAFPTSDDQSHRPREADTAIG